MRNGVANNMLKWIQSYLFNRRARVLTNLAVGRSFYAKGVPQGDVLSPTLFLVFTNDLVSELHRGVNAALYADDLVLWCKEEHASTANYRIQQGQILQIQALRIITGAMKSTPITFMEQTTAIQPLQQRRHAKVLLQTEKYKCLPHHPMKEKEEGRTKNRIKRSSFTHVKK